MTVKEEVREIELSQIRMTQGPERIRDIDTLAKSIAAVGLQIPLIVQPVPDSYDTKGNIQYLLVDGHRRFAALNKIKAKTARVIEIAEDIPGDKMQTIQLTANLHRLQLTAFEEAAAIKNLRDDGRETKDIAADLGLTPQLVARREQLLKLIPEWMKFIAAMKEGQQVSVAAFEMIASYEPSVQGKLLQHYQRTVHIPTVQNVKSELSQYDRRLKSAPWKLDDALLFPAAGACNACPKRSSCQSLLFDGEVDAKKATQEDKCLDIACWDKKLEKLGKLKLEAAKGKHPNLVLLSASPAWNERANRVVPGLSRGNRVFQKRSWGSNDFEPAKKSDKDAVPAMTINEKGLGSISYIKIKKTDEPKKSTKAAAKKLTPEELEKQRIEELGARREEWIKEQVEKLTNWQSKPPAHLTEMNPKDALLLVGKAIVCSDAGHQKRDLDNWPKFDYGAAIKAIWSLFTLELYLDDWAFIRQVAEHLLGLNWAELEDQAAKAIPDAKPKVGAAPEKTAGKK